MTLEQLIETFINSDDTDWNRIACSGHGSGPSYRDHFTFWNTFHGQNNLLTMDTFPMVASYKPDLSITIAWGLRFGDDDTRIDEAWAINNPNPSPAGIRIIDLFYNNSLVFRTEYAVVDGGRCNLPLPGHSQNGNLEVAQGYSDFIKKLNSIESDIDYDVYFGRTGITLVNERWY